jgi:hypothetical protein
VAKKLVKVDIGTARTYGQADNEIAFLVEKYLERHPNCFAEDGAIDLEAILDWAFESRIYQPKPVDPRVQLRRRVTRHLGHRYLHDRQGREVRALIAVPVERITPKGIRRSFSYYPLFETEATIIQHGLSLRRGWAFKRVEQIETDRQSYNDNNSLGQEIPQMSFNFDAMLARSAMPTTYPTAPPSDIDDEDDSLD